jgi:rhodanese-related sulfurtransferase
MSNDTEFVLPEITPQQLAEWLKSRPELVVLDVREVYEFPRAKLSDERVAYAPLSDLARKSLEGLPEKIQADRAAPLVVICHHGNRSAQVTAWLLAQGWTAVYNLAGGIDAYARQVDPGIGRY